MLLFRIKLLVAYDLLPVPCLTFVWDRLGVRTVSQLLETANPNGCLKWMQIQRHCHGDTPVTLSHRHVGLIFSGLMWVPYGSDSMSREYYRGNVAESQSA